MSDPAELHQSSMQRSAMKFMPGKISSEKYEQRVDNCTKDQLSLLLTCPDYQQWQHNKQAAKARSWKPSPEVLLSLLCFVMLPLVALAPYYLPSHQQQVSQSSVQQSVLAWTSLFDCWPPAHMTSACGGQVTSSAQQYDIISQPKPAYQEQHVPNVWPVSELSPGMYSTKSNIGTVDEWGVQTVSDGNQQQDWSAMDEDWPQTDSTESVSESQTEELADLSE